MLHSPRHAGPIARVTDSDRTDPSFKHLPARLATPSPPRASTSSHHHGSPQQRNAVEREIQTQNAGRGVGPACYLLGCRGLRRDADRCCSRAQWHRRHRRRRQPTPNLASPWRRWPPTATSSTRVSGCRAQLGTGVWRACPTCATGLPVPMRPRHGTAPPCAQSRNCWARTSCRTCSSTARPAPARRRPSWRLRGKCTAARWAT